MKGVGYTALAEIRSGMADKSGDIMVKANDCGCVMELTVDKKYDVTRMRSLICGKEIKVCLAICTECAMMQRLSMAADTCESKCKTAELDQSHSPLDVTLCFLLDFFLWLHRRTPVATYAI